MGITIPQGSKKKAVVTAIVGGIVAGAATMFIPTSVLETLTGATGLSEIVPATAAPLGDTARALIAFGAGALTIAILVIMLLRRDGDEMAAARPAEKPSEMKRHEGNFADRVASLKDRIPQIKIPKMPWVKGENEIRDLGDLPSLRGADAHPDAPARRPLLANKDIPVEADAPRTMSAVPSGGIEQVSDAPVSQHSSDKDLPGEPVQAMPAFEEVVQAAVQSAPAAEAASAAVPEETNKFEPQLPAAAKTEQQPATAETIPSAPVSQDAPVKSESEAGPSLDAMIGQLQNAVSKRKQQLAKLEAAQAAVSEESAPPPVPAAKEEQEGKAAAKRPPLEAVPPPAVESSGDMDQALNAALETLQRMNAQAR